MNFSNTLSLLTALTASSIALAQGNTPCSAAPLPVNATCVNTSGTNVGSTDSGIPNPGCAFYSGEDVWYSITVPASGSVTVTTSGNGGINDTGLAMYSGPCGSPTLLDCDDDGGTGLFSSITLTGQTPGATLYVRVWDWGGGTGTFNICAEALSGGGVTNDTPCTASPLTVNTTCTYSSGTNFGATDSGVPNPGCASYSGGDVWYTVTVPASGNVTVTTDNNGGIGDGGMAIYSGPCGAPTLIDCDDDGGPGLFSSISLTGQTPGTTLYVRVWEFNGGPGGTFDICATDPDVPTNVSCDVPDPICSGSPIVFTAQSNGTDADVVNPGNNYDCLFTSPNPSWYYLEIATGGNLDIDITAGSDIDFAIWGPFPDLATAVANCDSYGVPIDCSYSIAAVEQANVVGVVPGEVYVLLVTNFANTVQTITVDEAATNSASTDCSIVPLPVELVDFKAVSNGSEVNLSWSTLSERENDFFVVERSYDGAQWTSFEMVQGAGNSNVIRHYEVVDQTPNGSVVYYRLKQFDFDGSVVVSDPISLVREGVVDARLYPNPAGNLLQVSSTESIMSIDIVSPTGALAMKIEQINGNTIDLNTESLPNGVYFVSINTANETIVKRLVIAHE